MQFTKYFHKEQNLENKNTAEDHWRAWVNRVHASIHGPHAFFRTEAA